MKILTIDDSELILGMIQMIGSTIGIEVEISETIPDTISPDFDYVVVDLNLPDVDDSVAWVRERFAGRVIVLSGLSSAELDALDLRVEACWSKDIGMMGLQQKLESLVNS